jgi:type II secretory pathway component GspD/PulD (secretin)
LKGQKKEAIVVAEPVSNTILLSTSSDLFKQLAQLISDLDAAHEKGPMSGSGTSGATLLPGSTGTSPGGATPGSTKTGTSAGPPRGRSEDVPSSITVMKLKHAKAEEISLVLKKVFQTVEITSDPRTNQLIVQGIDEQVMKIRELIVQLDVEGPPSR